MKDKTEHKSQIFTNYTEIYLTVKTEKKVSSIQEYMSPKLGKPVTLNSDL